MSMWDLWKSVDWGKLLVSGVQPEAPVEPPPTGRSSGQGPRPLARAPAVQQRKPGCEAAEATIDPYGTLLTLADGLGIATRSGAVELHSVR